ncbi:NADH-quinone oxidoreductase subunit G [Nocardia sp. 348MFTsu5.1]|uniref:NADH-quinone oxidoreductase subunit G n=1 Tax=Nocardia sp. 348MFTsu5.1 TaxID=1172185 RepID=UPI0003715B77|nr:NADH-quinone oxidoreductase subunit G [Nocardia sp. 348MFTsu5.1]
MTLTNNSSSEAAVTDLVAVTIDGTELKVPKGTLVIRAAELIGVQIPRFCDHPLLDPVGACRQCLVEVEGQRKPLASCTTTVSDGMVVRTQLTSPEAEKAQRGVMELLLINHPLDCPVCDKGGECPLQNQAMSNGQAESRFEGAKRTFPKPIPLSSEVLLDRERCVMCARCTRFSDQVAGDRFIDLLERGAQQQVGIADDAPFESYFSGNTVQICPVGALTGAAYRFRARPFDLVSSPSVCEHCADGCAQRTDHRRGKVLRRLAGDDPEVNEEWNCDKGRWAFTYETSRDRITTPLIRNADGNLVTASWPQAVAAAAAGLKTAGTRAGVLVGGRTTAEDAYAYGKFARTVLGTNNIDFRNRAHSSEEASFLSARIAGRPMALTYSDLEKAPTVLLAGFEPEEESPIIFLRLRKAARKRGLTVISIAPFASNGLRKMSGGLIKVVPGAEPAALEQLRTSDHLKAPGAVILVGERLAQVPGALTAVGELADATGATIGWVPRRAGERGALEVGALGNLLPGGRPVSDPVARAQVRQVWGTEVPPTPGLDTAEILAAAATGDIGALVVGGVELADLPDPDAALAALAAAPFVVSLEMRESTVTDLADVVFPVSPVVRKDGTFVDWEGRPRSFDAALPSDSAMPDQRVLDAISRRMGRGIDLPDAMNARDELGRLGPWDGDFETASATPSSEVPRTQPGQAVLASWRMLLDSGRLQDGEPHLAGTARRPVVRLSEATATENGVRGEELVTVSSEHGSITLPLEVTDLPDRVVWLPLNSPGSSLYTALGPVVGQAVQIAPAARVERS